MHYSTNKSYYTVYTLIDITNKQVNTPKQDKIGYYQSQNFNTFLQTISLRTQPNIIETKFIGNKDLKNYNFGTSFKKRKVWIIKFECDTPDVYKKENNPVHLLEQDFENVPVHAGLKSSVKDITYVDTVDKEVRNTYITFNQE